MSSFCPYTQIDTSTEQSMFRGLAEMLQFFETMQFE